jgi:hypothetical protein
MSDAEAGEIVPRTKRVINGNANELNSFRKKVVLEENIWDQQTDSDLVLRGVQNRALALQLTLFVMIKRRTMLDQHTIIEDAKAQDRVAESLWPMTSSNRSRSKVRGSA